MSNLRPLLAKEKVALAEVDRLYLALQEDPSLVAEAISCARQFDPEIAWRPMALVHRAARNGRVAEPDLVRLASIAEELTHWASRLYLCQVFARCGCPVSIRRSIYPWLVECFGDPRVITRAWALSALVGFIDEPEYRTDVEAMLRAARKDPAPSMRARLRQLDRICRKEAGRNPKRQTSKRQRDRRLQE